MLSSKAAAVTKPTCTDYDYEAHGVHPEELCSIVELMETIRNQDSGRKMKANSVANRLERRVARNQVSKSNNWTEIEAAVRTIRDGRLTQAGERIPPTQNILPRSAYFGLIEEIRLTSAVKREELKQVGGVFGPAAISAVTSETSKSEPRANYSKQRLDHFYGTMRTRPPSPYKRKTFENNGPEMRSETVAYSQVNETRSTPQITRHKYRPQSNRMVTEINHDIKILRKQITEMEKQRPKPEPDQQDLQPTFTEKPTDSNGIGPCQPCPINVKTNDVQDSGESVSSSGTHEGLSEKQESQRTVKESNSITPVINKRTLPSPPPPFKYRVQWSTNSAPGLQQKKSTVAIQRSRLTLPSNPSTISEDNNTSSETNTGVGDTPSSNGKTTPPDASIPTQVVGIQSSTMPTPKASQVMMPIKLPTEMRAVDIQKLNRMYSNKDIIDESERRVKKWLGKHIKIQSRTPFTTSTAEATLKWKRKGRSKKVKSGRKSKMNHPADDRPIGPKISGLGYPTDFANLKNNGASGENPVALGNSIIIRTKVLPFPQPRYKRVMEY